MRVRVYLAIAGIALLAGLTGAIIASRQGLVPGRNQSPSSAATSKSRDSDEEASTVEVGSELDVLRARIAKLEHLAAQSPPLTAPSAESPKPRLTEPEEPTNSRALTEEQVLRDFSTEGIDPTWAPQTKRDFETDLHSVATSKNLKIVSVDCKTTLCRARIQWAKHSDIEGTLSYLVPGSYKQNCATVVFTPPPDDPSRPYEANLFFNCTSAREEAMR